MKVPRIPPSTSPHPLPPDIEEMVQEDIDESHRAAQGAGVMIIGGLIGTGLLIVAIWYVWG